MVEALRPAVRGVNVAEVRLSPDEIRPIVREVVEAVIAETERFQTLLNGKLAVRESEAAQLLGLNPWQLRDLRLSGKITFSRIVGNRIRYTPQDLEGYLKSNHRRGNDA